MSDSINEQNILLFNSKLETGIRSLVVLNASYPKKFDLLHLIWFDHLVVHTGDIDGPSSLHPDVPSRNGELLVRRTLIEEGLKLMRQLHLINVYTSDEGITYQASDESPAFVALMSTKYSIMLLERAKWLTENICNLDSSEIQKLISDKIGQWDIEFQNKFGPQELHL